MIHQSTFREYNTERVLNMYWAGAGVICLMVYPWIRSFKGREKIAKFVRLHECVEILSWVNRLESSPAVRCGVRVNVLPSMNAVL